MLSCVCVRLSFLMTLLFVFTFLHLITRFRALVGNMTLLLASFRRLDSNYELLIYNILVLLSCPLIQYLQGFDVILFLSKKLVYSACLLIVLSIVFWTLLFLKSNKLIHPFGRPKFLNARVTMHVHKHVPSTRTLTSFR